jgi:transposase
MVTRLKSRTARQMLNWRHYQFKQRLLHKASEHPWCEVLIVEEPYTVSFSFTAALFTLL